VARVIQYQRNPWGAQAGLGGEEPQRSDLWIVDLSSPLRGISTQLNVNLPPIPSYFAQSVSLPELRVRPDVVRRDSRPYNMPSWDDPLDPVKISFILDAAESGVSSRIYSVLDAWRSLVRAGRGKMSKESTVVLNENYRIDFQFNITVMLLKGGAAKISQTAQRATDALVVQQAMASARQRNTNIFTLQTDTTSTAQQPVPESQTEAAIQQAQANAQASAAASSAALLISNSVQLSSVDNDLQYSGAYTLQNCWLGAFRVSDLAYGATAVSLVEATFYAEDVYDENNRSTFE
jgi:hypothetical protein